MQLLRQEGSHLVIHFVTISVIVFLQQKMGALESMRQQEVSASETMSVARNKSEQGNLIARGGSLSQYGAKPIQTKFQQV